MIWKTVCIVVLATTLRAYAAAPAPPTAPAPEANQYFAIEVVDEQTGRGVPMVELQTTSSVPYYTDSAGLIAFNEPGLMNQKVFFNVASHGYEAPQRRLRHPRRRPGD